MMKQSRGITLVALIITIIILLILSGITIASLTGSGLFNNTKEAKEKSENAQNKENQTLLEYENEINKYINENSTISSFEELLIKNGIASNYSKEDVANNKDGILEKILSSNNSIEYIFNNTSEYIDIFTSSEQAMTLLGKNSLAIQKIINSEEWCKKIADSQYRSNFSEYFIYNANTIAGTAGGRSYYKLNEGFALSGVYYRTNSGAIFILVGRNPEDVQGYCSYNTSYVYDIDSDVIGNVEYNGQKWYYCQIPYGWTNGQNVNTTNNSKYIGNIANDEEAAIYILNDFFGTN